MLKHIKHIVLALICLSSVGFVYYLYDGYGMSSQRNPTLQYAKRIVIGNRKEAEFSSITYTGRVNAGLNQENKKEHSKPFIAKAPAVLINNQVFNSSGELLSSRQFVGGGEICKPGRNKTAEIDWLQKNIHSSKTVNEDSEKARKIVQMMQHAWTNYEKYTWGANELSPDVKLPADGPFPGMQLGLTIVDALDTLWIMGLFDEVQRGKDWLVQNLPKRLNVSAEVSVFEFNIRFVGGLLSMYALTNECEYKDLAKLCADKMLPAFNTRHGLPLRSVNLKYGVKKSEEDYGTAVLSEMGTIHLEFVYLSYITGDNKYVKAVNRLRDTLVRAKVNGLYGNVIDVNSARFVDPGMSVSLGALGDSFYEYLYKSYLQTGKTQPSYKKYYFDAMQAVKDKGLLKKSFAGLKYFAILSFNTFEDRMEHLTCFIGGLIGLSAQDSTNQTQTLQLAEDLAYTCHESYIKSGSHLGPESFSFDIQNEAVSKMSDESAYKLRPEVVETWFVLHRITHKDIYREWAWQFVEALEKYCKVENGYSGLTDVYLRYKHNRRNSQGELEAEFTHDDIQQSYFLAETLKYLYLIYKGDDIISLNDWVFNSEAHPLPVLH